MLVKYMGSADYRGFAIGDTLDGQAPALPVNVIFSKDTGIDPYDHIIDTTAAAYSGVAAGWWTALLLDSHFMNVTGIVPPPAGAWDSLYGFETQPTSSSDGDVPLTQKGVPNGVATLDGTGNVPLAQLANAPAGGGGGAPSGAASGDLSGTYPGPNVAKVQGVAFTAAAAQLAAQLNEATVRSGTSTLAAGESTLFSGSSAGQTLTMPASTSQVSSPNAIMNLATVNVTIIAGAGTTLNYMGTVGNITLTPNMSIRALLIGTVWYVFDASFGSAGGDLSGSYPNPTVARLNGLAAASYALLASPAFTGNPTATTQAGSDNSTRLATTAFVQAATALSLALTGGAMTGAIAMGNHAITGLATPVNPGDAVTKAYADALTSGLSTHAAAQWATAGALPAVTYNNGAGTLTATANGAIAIDGGSPALNDRIVVKDQASQFQNGIYTVTTVGSGAAPFVLTRATDMNLAAEVPGAYVFVESGATNAGAGFVVANPGPFTLGTTAIVWTQFSGAGEILAGTGLAKTGNTISLQTPVTAANGGTGQTTLAGVTLDKWGAAVASVSMGGNKITNVSNGTAASDVAAFGQIPTALPPNGAASGDLGGTYPGPSVAKVQGIAQTTGTATLLSQLNNAIVRSTSAAVQPGEETVFSGSTAGQTLTLPGSTAQASSINQVVNISSVNVVVVPGTGTTLNNVGIVGNFTLIPGASVQLVLIGSVWYVFTVTTPAPAASTQNTPIAGGKLVVVGHSYAGGFGATPYSRGWAGMVASMARTKLWNQAINGAVLGMCVPPTVGGAGGIAQCLQSIVPTPQQVNWRGPWSATAYYPQDDGVSSATTLTTCATTSGSPTMTTTGSFATSGIVAGMVIAGPNIPGNAYVKSVESATSLTMNVNANGTASAQTVIFTGWYRNSGLLSARTGGAQPTGVTTGTWVIVTPPAVSNGLTATGQVFGNGGSWSSAPYVPIVMFGVNDLGDGFQKSQQNFLSALQCLLARLSCAAVWEDNSPLITYAGGTWTNFLFSSIGTFGSGNSVTAVPNTAGATLNVNTPPDWPGGFVDLGFTLGVPAAGSINFTVDGSNVNCKCNGMADGPLVNFGSPKRTFTYGTSLTTALAAGVAVTTLAVRALPVAVVSGDTITVGGGPGQGAADTFVANGAAALGATSITVTSHAPTNAHGIGDSVADTTSNAWGKGNCVVVRVPVPAGPHSIVGNVQASPAVNQLYFDWAGFEADPLPTGAIIGLQKILNSAAYASNPTDADVDTWNAGINTMIGSGKEFPHVYVNIGNILKQSSALGTALTQGQTGITALDLTGSPLLVPVATGDTIIIGSGPTQQQLIASAPGTVGNTSLNVQSFTSTFAQPIGASVMDLNYAQQNFDTDGVHPSIDGHALTATLVWTALQSAVATMTQNQIAQQAAGSTSPVAMQTMYAGSNIVVGTGVANAWGKLASLILQVSAEPGDILEISVNGIWDVVGTINGFLDIATISPLSQAAGQAFPNYVINYLSGVGANGINALEMGLGWQVVGAQAANGLVSLSSTETITTIGEKITGKFLYPVQVADLVSAQVSLVMLGKASTTGTRNILLGAGNQFSWSVRNLGPIGYNGAM